MYGLASLSDAPGWGLPVWVTMAIRAGGIPAAGTKWPETHFQAPQNLKEHFLEEGEFTWLL